MRQQKPSVQNSTAINQEDIHPQDFVKLYGQPPVGSAMHARLVEYQLLEEEFRQEDEEVTRELFETDLFRGGEEDDEEVFQLAMPE